MALNSTIGDPAADSYVSVADADTYWSNHGSPDMWTTASTGTKEAALRYATEWLDQTFQWYSFLMTRTQSLNWPRVMYISTEGRVIAGSGVIPDKVVNATCLMALEYIKFNFTSSDNEGIKLEQIGFSRIEYYKSSKTYAYVKMSLKEYGTPTKSSGNAVLRC